MCLYYKWRIFKCQENIKFKTVKNIHIFPGRVSVWHFREKFILIQSILQSCLIGPEFLSTWICFCYFIFVFLWIFWRTQNATSLRNRKIPCWTDFRYFHLSVNVSKLYLCSQGFTNTHFPDSVVPGLAGKNMVKQPSIKCGICTLFYFYTKRPLMSHNLTCWIKSKNTSNESLIWSWQTASSTICPPKLNRLLQPSYIPNYRIQGFSTLKDSWLKTTLHRLLTLMETVIAPPSTRLWNNGRNWTWQEGWHIHLNLVTVLEVTSMSPH